MSEKNLTGSVKNISCRICSLSNLCIPHGLSQKELEQLDSVTKDKQKLERGDCLFHAGDSANSIFSIRSGSFKTIMNIRPGIKQITGFQMPGQMLGLDGMGSDTYTYSTIALETSTVCEISIDDLDRICAGNKSLRHQIFCLIGKELHRERLMILVMGQMNGEERIASFLLDLSNQHRERGLSGIEFNLTMSRSDIANYLGFAKESLSRHLAMLQDRGILKINNKNIRILEWDSLCKLGHALPELKTKERNRQIN